MKKWSLLNRHASIGGLATALAIFAASQAQGAVLYGYIQDSDASAPTPAPQVVQAQVEVSHEIPAQMEGAWQCMTTVTNSMVDSVPQGQQVVSRVDFVRGGDGKIAAHWQQAGWVEGKSQITTNGPHVVIDRTSYYMPAGANGTWACRSRDRYNMIERDKVVCASDVDQYMAGAYMGRYRTNSVLVRLRDDVAYGQR